MSSWEVLEPTMKMGFLRRIMIWILKKMSFETTTRWARYLFHYSFERTIDLANSFAIGHHNLERRLHEMAKTSTRVRSDPTLCHIHSLDPVVLEIVAAEVNASSEAAKDLVRSALQANNELLKSVASKQAVRYLLKGIVKAVEHEHEIGEIDDTEKDMLETCTKFCMLRLNRGAMLAPPPSIDSFLRRIPFLKNLDQTVLAAIANMSKERHIASGSMLFKQNRTAARGLHLILGGRVAVFERKKTGTTPKQKGRKTKSSRWSITKGTRWSITNIAKAVIAGNRSKDAEEEEEGKEEVEDKQKGAPLTSRWSITDMIQNVSQNVEPSNSDLGKCAMVLEKGNEFLGTLSLMTGELHYMSAQAQSMVLSLYIPAWCINKILLTVANISIGPDEYFLDASTDSRRKSSRHSVKRESSKLSVGFESNSDSSDDDGKEEEEDTFEENEKDLDIPECPVERTSRISFKSNNVFEIPEMDAVVFCEGILKNAALHACLTVLEYDVVSAFKLRALDLQGQMTKMCDRAVYMKVRPNETVYLPRPCVLISGHLQRVYLDDEGASPIKYSGVAFVPNLNPNNDQKFEKFVYRASNQTCDNDKPEDKIERNVQLIMFDEEDVLSLDATTRMRRRLVKKFSSSIIKKDDKKARVVPIGDESEEEGVKNSHRTRNFKAKRKHSLFGRIFTSHVFHGTAHNHGPQTHKD